MPVHTMTIGPGSLIFGETGSPQEFNAQCTSATVSWSFSADDDVPVLSGEVVAGDDTNTAVISGNCFQDLTENGFTTWSWTNRGQVVPFIYVPNDDLGRAVVGEVKVRPTDVGGDVKTKARTDWEFPCVGEPELSDVTP